MCGTRLHQGRAPVVEAALRVCHDVMTHPRIAAGRAGRGCLRLRAQCRRLQGLRAVRLSSKHLCRDSMQGDVCFEARHAMQGMRLHRIPGTAAPLHGVRLYIMIPTNGCILLYSDTQRELSWRVLSLSAFVILCPLHVLFPGYYVSCLIPWLLGRASSR